MACCGEVAAVPEADLAGPAVREALELVAELCRHFYAPGWVTGTGGSITVKVNDPDVPLADRLIVMSPSGNQPPSVYQYTSSQSLLFCNRYSFRSGYEYLFQSGHKF